MQHEETVVGTPGPGESEEVTADVPRADPGIEVGGTSSAPEAETAAPEPDAPADDAPEEESGAPEEETPAESEAEPESGTEGAGDEE